MAAGACEHTNFRADVKVCRLLPGGDGPAPFREVSFNADVHIMCEDCGQPFRFIGFECGMLPYRPMVSADETELRLPIQPLNEDTVGTWAGFRVSVVAGRSAAKVGRA